MFSLNELMAAFGNNLLFAWEVLYADILLESAPLTADRLRALVLLYSKGLQHCAHLQDSQNNYFKLKIDTLMGQRKVVQCLHDEHAHNHTKHADAHNPSGTQPAHDKPRRPPVKQNPMLQARKREIETRLAFDIEESRTSKLAKMLQEESAREERLQGMLLKCISSEEEKLTRRVQQRRQRASTSGRLAASLKLADSLVSTCSYGLDSSQCLDSSQVVESSGLGDSCGYGESFSSLQALLSGIPFISDPDL